MKTSKELIKEVDFLSFEQKYKIWQDYMITTVYLRHDKTLYTVGDPKNFDKIDYPLLGLTWVDSSISTLSITPFFEFISSENIKEVSYPTSTQTVLTGIYEWYSRFSQRILKNKI